MDQARREMLCAPVGTKRPLSRLPSPRVFSGKPAAAVEGRSCEFTNSVDAAAGDAEWTNRIGVRVCVGGAKVGTLLYYGRTQFAEGVWCGVMLDEPVGKNNGTVNGVRYFDCPKSCGIFAPPHKVHFPPQDDKPLAPTIRLSAFDSIGDAGRSTWPPPGHPRPSKLNFQKSSDGSARKRSVTGSCFNSPAPRSASNVKSRSTALNSTTTCTPKLAARPGNVTLCRDQRPTMSKVVKHDSTFVRDVVMSETFALEAEDRCDVTTIVDRTFTTKDVAAAEVDFWTLDEDVEELVSGIFFKQRQGSVDLDESLGILTPDQMKDFTLVADPLSAQTPSDEGIQEIAEEEVLDVIDAEMGHLLGQPCVEVLSTNALEENLEDLECYDSPLFDDVSRRESVAVLLHHETKTSTPLDRDECSAPASAIYNWPTPLTRGITDVRLPEMKIDQSHFDTEFSASPVLSNNTVVRLASLLKLDLSDILVNEDGNALSSANVSNQVKVGELGQSPNTSLAGKADNDDREEDVEGMTRSIVKNAPLSVTCTVAGSSLSSKESSSSSMPLKRDSLPAVPEAAAAAATASNGLPITFSGDDGAIEYLLQRMSNNFAENTLVATKPKDQQQNQQQQMAVSVTSIDTGYQGDAECELQSDAGTNAANTPVEESSSSHKNFEMPELVKCLKGVDPGSDSDFCSDMGTSLTESEVDQTDDRARGRCARVIDGRLYMNANMNHAATSKNVDSTSISADESHKTKVAAQMNSLELVDCHSVSCVDVTLMSETVVAAVDKKTSLEAEPESVAADSDAPLVVCEMVAAGEQLPAAAIPSKETVKDASCSAETKAASSDAEAPKASRAKPESGVTSTKKTVSPKVVVSGGAVVKKQKSPKKNVMSKIKAMIVSTSNILSNKESPAAIVAAVAAEQAQTATAAAVGPAVDDDVINCVAGPSGSQESDEVRKTVNRTPKKSRWDAVMSKIAAGQAEEKEKGKGRKEVTSKVNTNLASAKTVAPAGPPAIKAAGTGKSTRMSIAAKKARPSSMRSSSSGVAATAQRPSVAHGSTDAADVSLQSCSDRSTSLLSNRGLTRVPSVAGKTSRPSTLSLMGQPVATSSPSPSQASVRSCGSPGSTLSQMTLASQASTRPPCDVSLASIDRSQEFSTVKNRSGPSPRPPLCAAPSASAAAATNRRSTAADRTLANSALRSATTTTVNPPQRSATSNTGQLRSFKPGSSGLAKPGHLHHQHDVGAISRKIQPPMSLVRTTAGQAAAAATAASAHPAPSAAVREVSRLEALCEARTKELNYSRMQLKHCVLAFDSFAVLIQYLTHKVNAFSVPDLNDQLRPISEELCTTRERLERSNAEQQRLQDDLIRLQEVQETTIAQLSERMCRESTKLQEELIHERNAKLDEMREFYQKEIDVLNVMQATEISNLQKLYDEQLDNINLSNQSEQTKLLERYMLEQQELINSRRADVKLLQTEHDQIESALRDKIKELVAECDVLKCQTKSLKEELTNDSDYRVQAASVRCNALQSEVDSLKVVLEMRLVETQELRREKLELSCQTDDLASARETIRKLEAKNEDLEARLAIRLRQEKRLTSEHQLLLENYRKEAHASKRLSLENEELQWKLQNNKEMHMFLSSVENSEASFNKGEPGSGNGSVYFWDNEGLLNSSINGAGLCSSPRTSFSFFKELGSAKSIGSPSPRGGSPRISPCKSPVATNKSPVDFRSRPGSAPVSGAAKGKSSTNRRVNGNNNNSNNSNHQRPSTTSEDEAGHVVEPKVRLRDKSKRKFVPRNICDPKITWSNLASISMKPDLLPSAVLDNDVAAVFNGDGSSLPEDFLVENDCFLKGVDGIAPKVDDCQKSNRRPTKIHLDPDVEETESAGRCTFTLEVKQSGASGILLEPKVEEIEIARCTPGPEVEEPDSGWSTGQDVESIQSIIHYESEVENRSTKVDLEPEVEETDGWRGPEVEAESPNLPLELESHKQNEEDDLKNHDGVVGDDEASIELNAMSSSASSSASSDKDSSCEIIPLSMSDGDRHLLVPSSKTTTTVVISFRKNGKLSPSGSRSSSPVAHLKTPSTSECCESSSEPSSSSVSRASSGMTGGMAPNLQVVAAVHDSPVLLHGVGSPRVSAGEAMMAIFDDPHPAHQLLRKALQEQLLLENGGGSSMDSSPLAGISKPDTPESMSQAVVPTDSSNAGDLSWSDDDLPSETEI